MNERSRERASEQDAEIMRLKGQLAEERTLRIAFEDKVTAMEDEMEELTAQMRAREEAFRVELERRNNDGNLEDEEEDRLIVQPVSVRSVPVCDLLDGISEMPSLVWRRTVPEHVNVMCSSASLKRHSTNDSANAHNGHVLASLMQISGD